MSFLAKLFGSKTTQDSSEQAVIVRLDGQSLPQAVYDECDLSTIEDQLIEIIENNNAGEFDGNEVGEGGATLYMYSPDAERLFSLVEEALRAYPLCAGARVTVRKGPPGSPEREVVLAGRS